MDPLLIVEFYSGALSLGIIVFCTAKIVSRRFDRKHPHLSRQGLRAIARKAEVRHASSPLKRRAALFRPEADLLAAQAREAELEQSLGHLGRNVASDLDRKRSGEQSAA